MKKRILFNGIGAILLSFILLNGCKDNTHEPELKLPGGSLSVKLSDGSTLPDKLNISKDSTEITFDVTAVGDEWSYTISDGAYWVSPKEKTESTLTLEIEAEHTGEKRTASVSFWLRAYTDTIRKVDIIQEAGKKIKTPLKADLLDVKFHQDGSAEDISPMGFTVTKVVNDHPFSIKHNNYLNRYVVEFDPQSIGKSQPAGKGSYYRIDYENNSTFKNKLRNGFSFECLLKSDHDYTTQKISGETKFFSMQQAGGISCMITSGGHKPDYNVLSFDPRVGKNSGQAAYTFCDSKIRPDDKTWYHYVGVWDKKNQKLKIYLNGQKEGQVDNVKGVFGQSSSGSQWIGIGGDSGPGGKIEAMFSGTIAIARIYSKSLTDEDVTKLWEKVKDIN